MWTQKIISTIVIVLVCYGQSFCQHTDKKLTTKFNGQWVNTSLFDSTSIKQKLSPWINEFYGTSILKINSADSVELLGTMDGGAINEIIIIDDLSFTTSEISFEPKFEYIPTSDLIKMTTKNNFLTVVFRRVKQTDKLEIIQDERQFESYFKALFFEKYTKTDKNLRIDKLWIGFETHTPFKFDAIGVKDKNGDYKYYGWELTAKTLRLYKTTRNTDKDSGFYFWTKGTLDREIRVR